MLLKNKAASKRIQFFFQYLILLFVIGLCLLPSYKEVSYHPDEGQWIVSSDSFETFISFNTSSPVWQEHHWTLTQPPLTRYIIGIGRWLSGIKLMELNIPNELHNIEYSLAIKNLPLPSDKVLVSSRLPFVFMATLSGLLVFALIERMFNTVAAFISVVLYSTNSYFTSQLTRAMGESPLLFFSLAVSLCLLNFLHPGKTRVPELLDSAEKNSSSKKNSLLWIICIGILGGLAASAKINGAITVIVCAIILFFYYRCHSSRIEKTKGNILSIRIPIFILTVSFLTFIFINPFLYHNPITRSGRMLKYRVQEMDFQRTIITPSSSINNIHDWLNIVPKRVFQDFQLLNENNFWILNSSLFVLGIVSIIFPAFQKGRGFGDDGDKKRYFVFYFFLISLPELIIPLDYDRYYLFPVLFVQVMISLGLASLVNLLMSRIRMQKKLVKS